MSNAVSIIKTKARFAMSDSFRICPPLLIQFTNQSANAVGEHWDFGDSSFSDSHNPSHFYTYPGVYTITLYAKGPGGCVDTMQRQIVVKGPKGTLTFDPHKQCRPYLVNFKIHSSDAVSYIWDFNDGNTLANTDSILTHTYQDSGSFVPKIILEDNAGCKVAVTSRDTLYNLFVKPSFTFLDSEVCSQDTVSFINNIVSNDSIVSWHWDFGDSATAAVRNPVHQYAVSGLYYPFLSVTTNNGCSGTYQSALPLKVSLSPDINVVSTGNGCTPLTTSLTAVQTGAGAPITQWYWVFGNGVTSTLQNPPQLVFSPAGNYTVKLTASNSNGCSKTFYHTVEAYPLPVLQLSPDTFLCRGKTTSLSANGANRYKWIPAAEVSCDSCASTLAKPAASTQYILTGTSLQGCSSRDSIKVNVVQPLAIAYSSAAKLCIGQSKKLQANGAGTYVWSPSAGLDNTVTATPVAQPDTTTTYRVIGKDDMGCFKDTGYIKLTVYPIPTVNAGVDKTINPGRPVYLDAVYSTDVTEVRWNPTGDIFRAGSNGITVKPIQNTEYKVEVKNAGGCAAEDRVTVFVTCNSENVFIPNLFSPNNDGVNDIFYPRGAGLFKIKTMRIYNRWGEAVFEKTSFNANDPSSGWDGTYKGHILTSDVYIYTIELICNNKSIVAMNGNISLVR